MQRAVFLSKDPENCKTGQKTGNFYGMKNKAKEGNNGKWIKSREISTDPRAGLGCRDWPTGSTVGLVNVCVYRDPDVICFVLPTGNPAGGAAPSWA